MKRAALFAGASLAVIGGVLYWLALPQYLPAADLPAGPGDAARGEFVFHAGGCISCHANADGGLGGGEPLPTPVGVFHPPNISPHPEAGIGAWSLEDFANAMQHGVAPDGSHLYPAFPYTSYVRMTPGDVADLFAYLQAQPVAETAKIPDAIDFPYSLRPALGLWKRAFLDAGPVVALPADASDLARRGQYLVEGPGHCGECHSPRTIAGLGPTDRDRWLAGAPNPEGQGNVPNITPSDAGIGDWTEDDIAYYLESGFTPDFDAVGGSMADVVENIAQLPDEDRAAIAAYLKAIPPIED